MVFNGFSMVFRQVVGTMPCLALNHQPSLAISLEKGLATARALNLTMLKSRWYTEYSYIQLPTRAWLTGKTPINGGCLYILGELSIAMFMYNHFNHPSANGLPCLNLQPKPAPVNGKTPGF